MAPAKSPARAAHRPPPRLSPTVAVSRSIRYWHPIFTAGAANNARTERIPHIPAPLPMAAADSSTASAASDKIPPTTGTAPEMAIRAAFPAAASAVPLTTPVIAM